MRRSIFKAFVCCLMIAAIFNLHAVAAGSLPAISRNWDASQATLQALSLPLYSGCFFQKPNISGYAGPPIKNSGIPLELSKEEKERLKPSFPQGVRFFFENYHQWRMQNPEAQLVILVRHGEAVSNLFRLVQDHSSASPLSRMGKKQAEAFAAFLAELIENGEFNIDEFFTSDLDRAHSTLRPLVRRLKRPFEKLKWLRETRNLVIGGIPLSQAQRLFPDYGKSFREDPNGHYLPPDYSIQAISRQMGEYIRKLESSSPRNVLIVSHGNAIRLSLLSFLNIFSNKFPAIEALFPKVIPNLGMTILSHVPGSPGWQLLVAADNSYLPEDLRSGTTHRRPRFIERLRFYGIVIARATFPPLRANPDAIADWFGDWTTFFRLPDSVVLKMMHRKVAKAA